MPFLSQEAQTGCQVPGVLLHVPGRGTASLPWTSWLWSCTIQEVVNHLHCRFVPLTPLQLLHQLAARLFQQSCFLTTGAHPSEVQGFLFASAKLWGLSYSLVRSL